MVSDAKQFCYFAFRALRHVPKDWRPHYRYELLNALRQRDFHNHTSKEISSRPEYYSLNAIKQGYHGVKWVLSRFDVECPPIPEAFADPDTPIYTNEATHDVYMRAKTDPILSVNDPYQRVRTISEAEALMASGKPVPMGNAAPSQLGLPATPFDEAMPYRMDSPEEMTAEDHELDEEEAEYGGTLYGRSKGYPDGMNAETAERVPGLSVWHSNKHKVVTREATKHFSSGNSQSGDEERHRKALASQPAKVEAPQFTRWVRGEDGTWVRKASIPEQKEALRYTAPWLEGEY
eukprot:Rhum_TRINITY_DN18519_c0_g1::Rhum_TRINITY_DN18519_c0_g1_i1::g.167533::m.167533